MGCPHVVGLSMAGRGPGYPGVYGVRFREQFFIIKYRGLIRKVKSTIWIGRQSINAFELGCQLLDLKTNIHVKPSLFFVGLEILRNETSRVYAPHEENTVETRNPHHWVKHWVLGIEKSAEAKGAATDDACCENSAAFDFWIYGGMTLIALKNEIGGDMWWYV